MEVMLQPSYPRNITLLNINNFNDSKWKLIIDTNLVAMFQIYVLYTFVLNCNIKEKIN